MDSELMESAVANDDRHERVRRMGPVCVRAAMFQKSGRKLCGRAASTKKRIRPFLKAAAYQDGHAGYSDPLDEQDFLVATINRLMESPEWDHMAVVVLYDDSDGWYDHQMGPIVNQSSTPDDALFGANNCGAPACGSFNGRCGYGPRQPLLVISRRARSATSSITR